MLLNPQINEIEFTPLMGFDLETTGLFPWHGADIDLIALSNEKHEIYVLETSKYTKLELGLFFKRIQAENVLLIGHNIKFDCNFILYHYNISLTNVFCTQVGAQILENGRQKILKFSLIDVIQRFLGPSYAISKEEKAKLQASFIDPIVRANIHTMPSLRKKQIEYAGEDATYLVDLYLEQVERIRNKGLNQILKLEMSVLPILSKMEVKGILIDKDLWLKLANNWDKELEAVEYKLDTETQRLLNGKKSQFRFGSSARNRKHVLTDLFGNATETTLLADNCINYGSPDQLLKLWEELGEEPPKDAEGKYGFGEDLIETYVTEQPNTRLATLISYILEYRGIQKLVSTYGKSFLEKLDKDSCIHTSYTQTRTETGRLSSREPNLQNIPSADSEDYDIRRCFIARPGYKLITCDMTSAEVAIAADYSKEPLLLSAMKEGADMHSELASVSFSIIFKQPIQIKNSDEYITIDGHKYRLGKLRTVHKSVTFAKFYKAGAKRIYQTLAEYINRHHSANDRMGVAAAISDALDARMPELSRYLSHLITTAKKDGKLISDKLGRIRYFNDTVYGEAANYPIQGTNANALKVALVRINKYLESMGYGSLLMNIHDEVVVEVEERFAEEAAQKVQEEMGFSLSYFLEDIKGKASVSIGNHWKK